VVQGVQNAMTRDSLDGLSPAEVMFGYRPRWDILPHATMPTAENRHAWLDGTQLTLDEYAARVERALSEYTTQMRARLDKKRVDWVPAVGTLVYVSRRAFDFPKSKLDLDFVGPVRVLKMSGRAATIQWLDGDKRVALTHLRPCHLEENPATLTLLNRLWAQWRSPAGPRQGIEEPGIWREAQVPDGIEDDRQEDAPANANAPANARTPTNANAPTHTNAPPSVPPPGILKGILKGVKAITSTKLLPNGRRIFKGTYMDPEKGTWFWCDLVAWDPLAREWEVTEQVLPLLRKHFEEYRQCTDAVLLEKLDFGDLPQFLTEAAFSAPFLEGVKARWAMVQNEPKFFQKYTHLKDAWTAAIYHRPT
jgi:hypothetical protein